MSLVSFLVTVNLLYRFLTRSLDVIFASGILLESISASFLVFCLRR